MHQHWKDRGNIKCTEKLLCDEKKQIKHKTIITPAEIEEGSETTSKSDTFQEEDDQQDEEQQATTTVLEPVEPEVNSEPGDAIPPINHETQDDEYDYIQLKDEYLELLEEVTCQPIKERKKLSRLKNDKKLKRVGKTLDKIIEETSTDNMDLTIINQI